MPPPEKAIILAGATGNLGGRIARELLHRKAKVRALVRTGGADKLAELRTLGAEIVEVDFSNAKALTKACTGGACVVSALSGLRDVVVVAQAQLLDAAVNAGVPRFIPSDFAIDFTRMPAGNNRNLDLRREFRVRLEKAPIAATSILNGMFADMLTGQAPYILFKFKRVLFWENADQRMDFTTVADTARYTALAALDPSTPRFLRIAGDSLSSRELVPIASQVTGKPFKLFRAGPLSRLEKLIAIAKRLFPAREEVYPPWQGMQYMHDMFDGRAKLEPLDNARYPGFRWTSVREVLAGGSSAGTAFEERTVKTMKGS